MKTRDYSNYKYYENREVSWLKFNERVLSEARDADIPLFERLKFLSITASNLDEFIMVRLASLWDMRNAEYDKLDIAGYSVSKQLDLVNKGVHKIMDSMYETYNDMLLSKLSENGMKIILHHEDLDRTDASYVDEFFAKEVYPVLTPMAVDSSRPFPLVRNKTLNIGALVKKKGDKGKNLEFATVQVPSVLSRLVELPPRLGEKKRVILLEEVIERNISKLFLNYDIVSSAPYRIMRNADLSIDEDEAEDLLKEIEKQIRMRQWGEAIKLEVEEGIEPKLVSMLKDELAIQDRELFVVNGPLDLTFLMKLYSLKEFDHLKEHSYLPPMSVSLIPDGSNIFEAISKQDIMLFHPYQTFSPVVDFIRQAAKDPEVLAIKQTLYRVSGNSPIIAALAEAAMNGKQVTVLVELKARFDEENNILWAKRLEQAGCHVIYGLVGLKTHSKITLVVRREEDGIKRYVHLGTGNYNDSTAKLYTDIGLLTSDEAIGEDATAVFNMLSGYSEPRNWNKLCLAPLWLKDRFISLIEREKQFALNNRPARIIAKVNSICDPDVIRALYEAAAAGVQIDLIVRGICCLKVGIPGTENNIRVRSIVGNFLEHARVFYFENGNNPEYYAASADWMPRNLERRVEILFPIEDEKLRAEIKYILDTQLADNEKAHELQKDGSYLRVKDMKKNQNNVEESVNSQMQFCFFAQKQASASESTKNTRVFVPKSSLV